jgi:hypothetical protein
MLKIKKYSLSKPKNNKSGLKEANPDFRGIYLAVFKISASGILSFHSRILHFSIANPSAIYGRKKDRIISDPAFSHPENVFPKDVLGSVEPFSW